MHQTGFVRLAQYTADVSALYSLRGQHLALHRPQQAITAFENALPLAPDFTTARLNLGFAFHATDEYDKALEIFDTVLEAHPELDSALLGKAEALNALGRHTGALRQYERAVTHNPLHTESFVLASCTHLEPGQHAEALRAFDQALSINPTLASAHVYRGMALLTQADFEHGLQEYEWREAVIFRPRSIDLPRWENSLDKNVTLLIYAEQGFGYTTQFARLLAPAVRTSE